MTPAQMYYLSQQHAKYNSAGDSQNAPDNNTGSKAARVNKLDPDNPNTLAVLVGLRAMKVPRNPKKKSE